jgi:antitoxin HigA-1
MPMFNPPHPGELIRTEIIEPLGLSVTAAAKVLRVSRPALSSLLNGKADLSGDMALRIEKAFGPKMDTLMRIQSAYDIARTRRRESKIRVRRYHGAEAAARTKFLPHISSYRGDENRRNIAITATRLKRRNPAMSKTMGPVGS